MGNTTVSKKLVACIAAALVVVPSSAMACCEYDAEKDAYVCGGGGTKDTMTNGGCSSRRQTLRAENDVEDGRDGVEGRNEMDGE